MEIEFEHFLFFFRSVDLFLIRYFVLNSIFLYTMTVSYTGICAGIEWIGLSFTIRPSLAVQIGLILIVTFLLLYSLFDRFVYREEFRSIWTPYLFFGYIFLCPPLRSVAFLESDPFNDLLFWLIFIISIWMIVTRLISQCRTRKKKTRINSNIEQISAGT